MSKLPDKYEFPWVKKIQRYLSQNQKARSLRVLDKVIDSYMPLFWSDPAVLRERRLAMLFRIQLLREWRRLSEALAWTCLECELNPNNVGAQAFKSQLKEELKLQSFPAGKKKRQKKQEAPSDIWGGVAGMRELKVALQEDVILPFLNPEIYAEYKVSLPNGILLYGPPGCGKTFIARKLAGILNFTFFEIKPSDLSSIYAHGGQTKIRELFNAAEEKAPSMIFFDEIDALIPRRSDSNVSHHYKGEVNEFLTQLDKSWDRRILIIGATNFLESLDSAVLRPGRIDKKIFIGPPDFEARVELLKEYMKGRPQEIIDWLDLGDRLEFYTAAEIEYVVNEAARKALNRRENISNNDLVEIIYRNPSQLNKNKVDEIRNPIGFL